MRADNAGPGDSAGPAVWPGAPYAAAAQPYDACRLTIGETALRCGFDDPSAFSRSFRRRYGCRPNDVRRESRNVTR
jgi:AraC-like DNA-binding protein